MLHARTETRRCDKRRKKNLHADLGYYGAKCSETIKKFGYNPIVPIKKQKGKSKPLMTTESKLNNAIRSPACPVLQHASKHILVGCMVANDHAIGLINIEFCI